MPILKNDSSLLSPKKVAGVLNICSSQVYNLLNAKENPIPHYRFGSAYRVDEEELYDWIERQYVSGELSAEGKRQRQKEFQVAKELRGEGKRQKQKEFLASLDLLGDEKRQKQKEFRAAKDLWRAGKKQREKEYQAAYSASHRLEARVRGSIRRAAIKGATIGDVGGIKEIYRRAGEEEGIICYLCGKIIEIGDRHVDHHIPVSRGGSHSAENLKITHSRCNLIKRARLVEEIPEGSF